MVSHRRAKVREEAGRGNGYSLIYSGGPITQEQLDVVWSHSETIRQDICAAEGRAREMELSKPFGAQKILNESQTSDTELYTWLDFSLASDITMPWFFPLGMIKYMIWFQFYRIPSQETLNF